MSYLVAYQPRAIREYEAAALWYKEQSIQAAENFEIAVNKKINILRINPLRYRKTYKEFREIHLDKYPFNLIYLVDEIKITVVISSIYHHKRNPKKKFK
jgi:plasmid stabilization system protein ParE